ncbi:endonuclease NucS [Corynebacterium pyruviciproducens]|uniref:endonuclease NucS n=1 Tax=Corynebacterium pyruviciproducens TaxID=598660 RepID=UPI0023F2D4E5|nr:endonuclease NucS [Corynebacterium pyruviciproducens]MDH4658058.1 endonuclease NucS [Corynebacterium pyruviciproducens]
MRLILAHCTVDYVGRLESHLEPADRLIIVKNDGSVSVHADDRAYKPLNWMSPPCTLEELNIESDDGTDTGERLWVVESTKGEQLRITLHEVYEDISRDLGVDPGLEKDGVEAHLQELLAEQVETLGAGFSLVRREYPTPIGPVDLLCRDADGETVAVEVKRRGGIDGVEQLTRYVELLNRDDLLSPVHGVFAAQQIKPQARTLAEDRGFRCVILDYQAMRGIPSDTLTLF